LQEELKKGEESSDRKPHNDLLANVLGGNDRKYVRTFGPLPLKMYSLDSSERKSKVEKKIVADSMLPKSEPPDLMKDKMKEMEKRHKDMEEEMNRMRSTMMAMQQFISTQQHLSDQMSSVPPGFLREHTGM
jgi:polyhydroxyalkanoate synthesis regulator phasin